MPHITDTQRNSQAAHKEKALAALAEAIDSHRPYMLIRLSSESQNCVVYSNLEIELQQEWLKELAGETV